MVNREERITSDIYGWISALELRWLDRLIRLREWILDEIAGTSSDLVLNQGSSHSQHLAEQSLVPELNRHLDRILAAAVHQAGLRIDYSGLENSPAFHSYREEISPRLKSFDPASLSSTHERLAFWINIYNALVLDGVISKNIKSSVIRGGQGGLLFFRQVAYEIFGQRLSCDDIEHGILRANHGHPFLPGPHFASNDPRRSWVIEPQDVRVHFALNCASRSCPPFGFYEATQLDSQIDLAVKNFLRLCVKLDTRRHTLRLSKIFHWYQGDFGGRNGVIDFLLAYLDDEYCRDWIAQNRERLRFSYEPYDWRLNNLLSTA